MTAPRPEQPTPDYVAGHGLLRDKEADRIRREVLPVKAVAAD